MRNTFHLLQKQLRLLASGGKLIISVGHVDSFAVIPTVKQSDPLINFDIRVDRLMFQHNILSLYLIFSSLGLIGKCIPGLGFRAMFPIVLVI